MTIKINNDLTGDCQCKLYDPDGKFVGSFSKYEVFNDIRIQIKKEGIGNYSIVFDGKHIYLDKYANLEYWPDNLFSFVEKQLWELIE